MARWRFRTGWTRRHAPSSRAKARWRWCVAHDARGAAADGRLRRLVPEELEVLNGFARGFTDIAGITPAKRGFLMGKALVTGLVTAIGRALWQAQT